MSTISEILPLTETVTPADQAALAEFLRAAYADATPVYPLGGGNSLDFGLPARQSGTGLALTALDRVVDYPARDMTITVEAGITMQALADQLATQRQWLPIDAPRADTATLGGLVALNYSGARRFGFGTLRDYVIGISAVDGQGTPFKAGGRVVKNVAGYDFCKLLTGSLGTLAVITQLTLKVKPLPESSVLLSCHVNSWEQAETLLAAFGQSQTTPSAVELLSGPAWLDASAPAGTVARLIVGLEGTAPEVSWMIDQLRGEWQTLGINETDLASDDAARELWARLTSFVDDSQAALVVKASVRPGRVTALCQALQSLDTSVNVQAHAGNGIIKACFVDATAAEAASILIQRLQPLALASDGSCVVWSCASINDLTRQAVWGAPRGDFSLMAAVKKQFDPKGLLNPGRFSYTS